MRATRNRQFPRPASMTEPVVRHEVWMAQPGRPARRLHGGVAMPAEAHALFKQASHDMNNEPGPECSIVLERHTVETLAMRRGPGMIVYAVDAKASPAEPVITIPPGAGPAAMLAVSGIAKAVRDALRPAREVKEPPAPEPRPIRCVFHGREERLAAGALDVESIIVALFKVAAHHQGGHSPNGKLIAEALAVPFPLKMADLSMRAMEVGLTPALLWPWRDVPGCRDADVAGEAECIICKRPALEHTTPCSVY